MSDFNRRDFIGHAVKGGLVFGTGFNSFADFARAQTTPDDEHFFIFVELRGGVQWMTATDGRDLDLLPLDDPKTCLPLQITDKPLTEDEYDRIVSDDFRRKGSMHGKFILLPYIDELKSSYTKGQTTLGSPYVMGFAGKAMLPHVDDVAVLRGVHVRGDFHGIANASGEIFSGLNSSETPHVSSVLATLLAQKHGAKLLDNLVFENATYSTGSSIALAKAPIRLDAQSLGLLVGSTDGSSGDDSVSRFLKARELAGALAASPGLTELHKKVFDSYINAMKEAPTIRGMLLGLKDQLSQTDASLDLPVQLKTAVTMLQAGLTRVVTLCLGAPNGKNRIDGFGLFDCHQGEYHLQENNPDTFNTQRHHLNVERSMNGLADLIKLLKATKFGNGDKTLFDVTTVVVGTEFSRPSNFAGNEASGGEGGTAFGCGHYNFNNNYVLFGKGVRGGAWVGGNDAITQMGHMVDVSTLQGQDPTAVKTEAVKMVFTPDGEGSTEESGQGFFMPPPIDYSGEGNRPFMAKDVVKSVLAIAGFENKYAEAYSEERVKIAHTLKPMMK